MVVFFFLLLQFLELYFTSFTTLLERAILNQLPLLPFNLTFAIRMVAGFEGLTTWYWEVHPLSLGLLR